VKEALKVQLATFLRQLAVAVVTAIIVIGGLVVAYADDTATERETFQEIRNATLAEVCVLALPVSESAGRNAEDVHACLRRYGLEP
jgi:succinate dehydrogenase hydrophobic anchor subunit